jgi:C4-dicarboxylate-specific signal transduction histidine kinase
VRTHRRKAKISDRGNILIFEKGVGLDLRNELQRRASNQLIEAERMSAIGRMTCSISHDIDSLLQFDSSGRNNPLIYECVSFVVEKTVAAVKFHPDGRNVSITVAEFQPAKAFIDARNLETAIYNLLLNACQAATRSTHVPEVKVQLAEVDERIYVTISDNGPAIPASVRSTLFDPFVTAEKPNGTGLRLTLARRIAEEHGGSVCLEESNRERTVFTLSLTKNRSLPLEERKSGRAASRHAAMDLRTAP